MKLRTLTFLSILPITQPAIAASIAVQNHSFEDTTGQSDFNEFINTAILKVA